ncbi:MAG: phosphoglycolate phosphatase [Pseudomonadota bacterium]
MKNYFSEYGARELQAKIEAYWKDRGHEVQVDVVPTEYDAKVRSVRYDVRSGLLNGLPRKCSKAA